MKIGKISKKEYDALLERERKFIPRDNDCFAEFWVNGFSHVVISEYPDGKFMITRGWIDAMNQTPCVSVDIEPNRGSCKGTMQDVVDYLIRLILEESPKMEIVEE